MEKCLLIIVYSLKDCLLSLKTNKPLIISSVFCKLDISSSLSKISLFIGSRWLAISVKDLFILSMSFDIISIASMSDELSNNISIINENKKKMDEINGCISIIAKYQNKHGILNSVSLIINGCIAYCPLNRYDNNSLANAMILPIYNSINTNWIPVVF